MFNAILEGTYYNDQGKYLKLLKRNIPLGVTRLKDHREICTLMGRTVNFQQILPHGETEEREQRVQNRESLSFGDGIILPPYKDDNELINLDIARLLCMRDGRIFITEQAKEEEEYIEGLESLLRIMQALFSDAQARIYFDHYTPLFKQLCF